VKIMAIIDVAPNAPMDAVRSELATELEGAWELFTTGVLREAYATEKPTRVVFVLESESGAEAERQLRKLPLVARGLMAAQFIELRPFANWARLFAPHQSALPSRIG